VTTHPLDRDSDGAPGGSLPAAERGLDALKTEAEALGVRVDRRWGEKRLLAEIERASDGLRKTETDEQTEAEAEQMTVLVANAIHDGKGGFLEVGALTTPVDDVARASLIAKGFAK
jgi:hypothetical protein